MADTNSRVEKLEDQINNIANSMEEFKSFIRFMTNAESSGETSGRSSSCDNKPEETESMQVGIELDGEVIMDHSYSATQSNLDLEQPSTSTLLTSPVPETPSYAGRLAKYSQSEELGPAVKEGLADFVNKTITTRLEP